MAYKYLNRSAVLEHLQEGQTVNIDEYIEKMQFFKKYGSNQGIYITDSRYIEYSEIGLHYYNSCGPFVPSTTSNSTACPSTRVL